MTDETRTPEEPHHKLSVALAIRNWANPDELLIVQRPNDDRDLPGVWGLPAATLRDDESWTDAAHRIGEEKLGAKLHIGRELNRGGRFRRGASMEMRLLEASIMRGLPTVPQPVAGVTQYVAWRWDLDEALRPGSNRGSLCCMLQLQIAPREARLRAQIRHKARGG